MSDLKKCAILFNGPSLQQVIDSDFGVPVIAVNWAARLRRFKCDWWVSYIAERCDRMMAETVGPEHDGVKIAADKRHLLHLFNELRWHIDIDLCKARDICGRDPEDLDSVLDTFCLAAVLGFQEFDVYGWDAPHENTKSGEKRQRETAGVQDLATRWNLKINRIGHPALDQPHPHDVPASGSMYQRARAICLEVTGKPAIASTAAALPAELERRAVICDGCENVKEVSREKNGFGVWAVKCKACGTCGNRPLSAGCPLNPPKF